MAAGNCQGAMESGSMDASDYLVFACHYHCCQYALTDMTLPIYLLPGFLVL